MPCHREANPAIHRRWVSPSKLAAGAAADAGAASEQTTMVAACYLAYFAANADSAVADPVHGARAFPVVAALPRPPTTVVVVLHSHQKMEIVVAFQEADTVASCVEHSACHRLDLAILRAAAAAAAVGVILVDVVAVDRAACLHKKAAGVVAASAVVAEEVRPFAAVADGERSVAVGYGEAAEAVDSQTVD